MEGARKDAGEIAQANPNGTFSTHRVSSGSVAVTCYRCGGGHLASECKHVKTVCSYCHKRGHLAEVCKTKRKDSQARTSIPHKQRSSTARSSQSSSNRLRVHTVKDEDVATASPSEVYDMWQINYAKLPPPFTVTVDICGKPLRMEVDTGASVSVMGKSPLLQLLPSVSVQPSQVFLRSYSGEPKKVEGKADILVKFHGKEADLPIFLTGDSSPTLLARNWMRELAIGLSNVEVNIHALSDIKHPVQGFADFVLSSSSGADSCTAAKSTFHGR
nr:uncharacterized protein LOC126540793 [Dermacentor andersoni]